MTVKSDLAIAVRAVRHTAHGNFFSAVALAAVLTPLLVLYGLKVGIVSGMFADLRAKPAMLQIGIAGHRTLSEGDIAAIRALPDTGFAAGAPRSISAAIELRATPEALSTVSADLLPSGASDPLLPDGAKAVEEGEIILSQRLAERLQVGAGASIVGAIYRNDQSETYEVTLNVAGVLPRESLAGDRGLVAVELLNRMAAFSDGLDPNAPRTPIFDSLRLYARSLESVAPLERIVASYGFRTSSDAAQIAQVQELDTAMSGVLAIVALSGLIGYAISLWAMITGSVRQSRAQLSLLRLLGLSWRRLLVFPLVQSLAITSAGLLLAFSLAFLAAGFLNRVYMVETFAGRICVLPAQALLGVAGATYLVGLLLAAWQAREIRAISPTEALAEQLG